MNEALQGNKDALKELDFNAGAGSPEAQYYFALYYKNKYNENDANYLYWLNKSRSYGYSPALEVKTEIEKGSNKHDKADETKAKVNYSFWFVMGLQGRINRSFYAVSSLLYFALSTSINGWANSQSLGGTIFVIVLIQIALSMFYIAQSVKRAHDLNMSGWWLFVPLVTIYLLFARGSEGENDYGAAPK